MAIRSCFVDTLSGFKAPGMFLTSDAVRRCPAFLGRVRASRVPRRHQYYQGTKTSCAEYGVTYGFASPLQPLPSSFAPLVVKAPTRAWPHFYSPVLRAPQVGRIHRISQVPGQSIPYLCPALRSRPARRCLTLAATWFCPQALETEDANISDFETQSRGFDICCLRFK